MSHDHDSDLLRGSDAAIIKLARALARQAAREDHERELAERAERELSWEFRK
jgi:hypothetical protein